ncbi:MAG: RagB/SusD family nutrient uptake outer membrane protein, partial [Tannerellaceae bacterium]|nr:RagB/SusD family nutrient uptake outer membrane protein [Tannerellaceae bacterium]
RIFKSEYTYHAERWEEAKKAAKAVLDLRKNDGTPRYTFYTKYEADDFQDINGEDTNDRKVQRRLWQINYDMDAIKNEWVMFVTRDLHSGWSGDMLPPSLGGPSRQRPVQEQVDEYEIIIDGYGYSIHSDKAKSIYDDTNPYVNRDPRFYRDIIYHGSSFSGNVINLAEGDDALAGNYQGNASHTGYYLRKFIKEGWNRSSGGHQIHGPAIFKLPTIIYIYAEAVNNTTGPNEEIYDLINQVRARVFMAPMPPEVKTDKTLMNEYIQRERRVELFYENDRVWHCRLYLEPDNPAELAKETAYRTANDWPYPKTQRMTHGMRPVEDPDGKMTVNGKRYRMERFKAEDRVFVTPRHYLLPLMDDELKRCPELQQNPGW